MHSPSFPQGDLQYLFYYPFFSSKENREKLLSSDELYSLSDLVLQFQSDTTTTSSSELCLFRSWVFCFFFFFVKEKLQVRFTKHNLMQQQTNKQTNKRMMTTRIPETLTLKTKFPDEFPSFFFFRRAPRGRSTEL